MAINLEITGDLVYRGDTENVTSSFRKRIFKVYAKNKNGDKYSNIFQIELVQDRCDILDDFKEGDKINCKCSLTGRDWVDKDGKPILDRNGKIINSTIINCWYIKKADEEKINGAEDNSIIEDSQESTASQTANELEDDKSPF
jgi:hypothetical protein